eukprot:Seg255.7 transcript_id=Seg255.7/GoldUCD/mRNA.D3Y31 product=Endochitinase protein_id=Seg255.7/GoldUCD/D3Y31
MMKSTLILAVLALALVEMECGGVYYSKYHCKKSGHFPDPHNCHAFIQCDESGKAFHHYCPKGTVFNPYIDVCDHKYNYKCGSYIPGHKKHGYGYLKGNRKYTLIRLLEILKIALNNGLVISNPKTQQTPKSVERRLLTPVKETTTKINL